MMRKSLALLLVFLLAACGGVSHHYWLATGLPKTRPDPLASRYIVLVRAHTPERRALVYYHNGGYDPRALRAIDYLFRDRRTGTVGRIDPLLIDFLVDIRTRLDLPETVPFEILSGYRTPESNAILARTNNHVAMESTHMRGWAADFRIPGVSGEAIADVARTMQRGGVAYYPGDNHVHVDIGGLRTWAK
ncbi:MAG TPA: DUF882 domain-containing protein [Alphaproteobacteria bacterium]|nr:DUF882 domain-containing protein [Alphaproteobacteria bacterium]